MLHSENIADLVVALSKAQGQICPAIKDSTNPHFKSKYADLSSVWEACREPLSINGLAVIQTTVVENERLMLITTLAHSSGQWIKSYLPVLTEKQNAQGQGSGLTYARRYGLAAIVGVCPDDDDGQAASTSNKKEMRVEPKKFEAPLPKQTITAEMAKELDALIGNNHVHRAHLMERLKSCQIFKLEDMPLSWFTKAIENTKIANEKLSEEELEDEAV